MLDKEGFIQESFFENKNNCLVQGKPFEAIREIEETIKNAINIVEYNQSKKDVEPQEKLPCIEFAENNWVEGNRQDLAMSLAGICRKKLNITQDEAENLIINIAEKNNDNEIPQRKAAIKSTYKIEDINHIKGCSNFDDETICGNCPYLKSQEPKQNREESTKIDKNGLLSLLKSTSDLMQEEDVKWVVKDLFAKKLVSVIFSEPGVGKTILAMDIAAKLTRGEAIFNHYQVERPMKVLYFQGDFPNTIMKNRLKQMFYNPDDKYFKLVNRYEAESKGFSIDLTNEQGQENLKTLLKEYKPDFVIFDTFISFFDGDENKQKDVKEPIDFLRKLTSNYDCSILLCHHSRKRGSNEKRKGLDQSDLIGSFVTARLCGLMLAIAHDTEKSTKDEKYNTVICAKTWFKPIEPLQFVISNNDNKNYTHGGLGTPKTGKIRVIDMSNELAKVLKEWRLACSHSELNLVFPNSNGNYQSADNLAKRRFLPALNRAGIDKIRFHDLRHTYASLLLANGAPMKYVQHQLGHSSITMTMDLYTHLLPEVNDKCVNLLNSIVNQTIEQQEVRRFGT